MHIAKTYELSVIEDAACALGTWIGTEHAGTIGDFGTFSFHPRKTITTGEGGMVLARDATRIPELQALRNHGINQVGTVEAMGFNYRLCDLQGAVGIGQMSMLKEFLAARQNLATRYNQALSACRELQIPHTPVGTTHPYQAYVCLLMDAAQSERDHLMSLLAERGIQTRPGTHAVHLLDWHRQHLTFDASALTNSAKAHAQTIALPLFPGLSIEEQDFVIEALKDCLKML